MAILRIGLYVGVTILLIVLSLVLLREFKQFQIRSQSEEVIKNGGISELHKLTIGGSEQYILVDGQSKDNPFMIFLHGGPGQPFPFGVSSRNQFPDITEKFTAVYYDQRGSGKSYHKTLDLNTMNKAQFIADANEVIDFVRKEYNQEKVYLVGLSWGSIIGLELASQYPEKFHAYTGISQIVNIKEGQVLGKAWLQDGAKNDSKSLAKLKTLGDPPYYGETESQYSDLVNKYNGFNYKDDHTDGANLVKLVSMSLISPDYQLRDIYASFVSGATFSLIKSKDLQKEIIDTNLEGITSLKIPFYVVQGKHDKTANFDLAKNYLEQIDAPKKAFFTLEHSAHMPNETDFEVLIQTLSKMKE